jgi:tetratricopeptide (TPR) repeat protein
VNQPESRPDLPELTAALAAAADVSLPAGERAEMLVEMAMGLQTRPKTPDHLIAALTLYDAALDLAPEDDALFCARILARKGTALQAVAEEGTARLEQAREAYLVAMPVLTAGGEPAELAEAEMNLGLVLQSLASVNKARIVDAIAAYQRSLRTFDRKAYPAEFAILQNNLATAFLSIPFSDERSKMREALAVQSFEEGLKAVTLIDHPSEYAMLQNNLGNALQYVSSSHALANSLRAVEAYDEALKVRTRQTTPLEYANTVSNKANCLWNLPDDIERPQDGNPANLRLAREGYQEAREIFVAHGEAEKARMVAEALFELERELMGMAEAARA